MQVLLTILARLFRPRPLPAYDPETAKLLNREIEEALRNQ